MLCTELFVKPGRGKARTTTCEPPSAPEVVAAFVAWYGHDTGATFTDYMAKTYIKEAYCSGRCYQTADKKKAVSYTHLTLPTIYSV